MSKESHIAALRQRHTELEEKIRQQESHPAYDQTAVSKLKAEKLRIKEEIDQMLAA
ncbi:MAG TPA: DUF465 domain-containing protein [Azospirillum sp.]